MPILKLSLRAWRRSPASQLVASLVSAALLLSVALLASLELAMVRARARVERENRISVFLSPEIAPGAEQVVTDRIVQSIGAHAESEVHAKFVPATDTIEALKVRQPELYAELRDLGVAVADIGAGTTDIVLFADGSPFHTAVLPLGGANVTNDVAIGLMTGLGVAEELKVHHGTVRLDRVGVEVIRDPRQIATASLVEQVGQVSLLRVVLPYMIGKAFERLSDPDFIEILARNVVLPVPPVFRAVFPGGKVNLSELLRLGAGGNAQLERQYRARAGEGVRERGARRGKSEHLFVIYTIGVTCVAAT